MSSELADRIGKLTFTEVERGFGTVKVDLKNLKRRYQVHELRAGGSHELIRVRELRAGGSELEGRGLELAARLAEQRPIFGAVD